MRQKLLPYFLAMIALISIGKTTEADEMQRRLRLQLPSLVQWSDVTTETTWTLGELIGKADDQSQSLTDRNPVTRLGNVLLVYNFYQPIAHYSHEAGHAFAYSRFGNDTHFRLDYKNERKKTRLGMEYPDIDKEFIWKSYSLPTLEELFIGTASGLNQEELNALQTHNLTRDRISFDQAIRFLEDKSRDLQYLFNLSDGRETKFNYRFITGYDSKGHKNYDSLPEKILNLDPPIIASIWKYRNLDLGNGIEEMKRRAFIADLLSVKTWDSVNAVVRYVIKGDRVTDTIKVKIGDDILVPPYVSMFYTMDGIFYVSDTQINDFDIQVGINPDFTNNYLLGVGIRNLRVNDNVTISPEARFNRLNHQLGYHLGTTIDTRLTDNTSLFVKLTYNDNDLIENTIKTLPDRFDTQIGIEIRW